MLYKTSYSVFMPLLHRPARRAPGLLYAGLLVAALASPLAGLELQRTPDGSALRLQVPPSPGRGVLDLSTNLLSWTPWAAVEAHPTNLNFTLAEGPDTLFIRFRADGFAVPTDFIWIAPGEFEMGSPEEEVDRNSDETRHPVVIPRGFWMARHEVTVAEFLSLAGYNPSLQVQDPTSSRPVDNLSAADADAYCRLLTESLRKTGLLPPGMTARLPTEAEWEYACRAGTTTRFYYGDDPYYWDLPAHGWYGQNAGGVTHPVGLLPPNPWGLHDMIGNVFEWCLDENNAYPGGVMRGITRSRIHRGGSFYCPRTVLRSGERHPGEIPATTRERLSGMRVVLAAAPDTVRFPPAVADLIPELTWDADATAVTIAARTSTPEAAVRYTDNGWPPSLSYGSGSPYRITGPASILARAFKTNHVATTTLSITVDQARPPTVRLTADLRLALTSEDPDAGIELRFPGSTTWSPYVSPLLLAAGTTVETRVRVPGKLTSQSLEISGP